MGRRLVELLADDDSVERVVAVDRRSPPSGRIGAHPRVVSLRLDVMVDDVAPALEGVDSVVHLVDDPAQQADHRPAATALDRVLRAATSAGCGHAVLLSSALVYGARPDNPVPLTEAHPMRPVPELDHAVIKAELEEQARAWAAETGAGLAVLRPAATLSEGDSSWIGAALRAATTVRAEQVDPPVQFLHHDDLAAATALAATRPLNGIYNVAPDNWIGNEVFRRLRGEADVRMPQRLSEWRLKVVKSLADRSLLEGLEPYVTWPWVVANDKLRAEGWKAAYGNEEAYVAGTPPPLLGSINPQRRQELALMLAGAAGAVLVGGAAWALRRTVR